ncbi:hypothetical protein F4813DRAFT_350041 [Daldinia decipiens]|uniref:uncharacterized protein n=1 Tax=Daldinia decipiens TaxID=326647 RepID=UPI0020C235C0|nr:uncharacterized protein F4813DRAFT_350041 [Daldinia decipiens]KAI1660466.1 hypothetical protein F4813DRAFT_350041 [Daldinia decipiens]
MATHDSDTRNTNDEREDRSNLGTPARQSTSEEASKVSLTRQAPTEPIPKRIWHTYTSYAFGRIEHEYALEQKNQCIRSQLGSTTTTRSSVNSFMHGVAHTVGVIQPRFTFDRSDFPYPASFLSAINEPDRSRRQGNGEDIMNADPSPERNDPAQEERGILTTVNTRKSAEHQLSKFKNRKLGFGTRWFGITRWSEIRSQTPVQPTYIVLGVFPRGYANPRETVVFIDRPEQLFLRLHWAAFRLRGLTSSLFSLRHVKEFRLYKCDSQRGIHESIDLDSYGTGDLRLLLATYKQWYVTDYMAKQWAMWIHTVLNEGSHKVPKGSYSLELVLDWSAKRISVVVLLPVLLSIAIDIWLNSKDWTDLATIQTAWGTASYIVTAGGRKLSLQWVEMFQKANRSVTAALLGILSSISD